MCKYESSLHQPDSRDILACFAVDSLAGSIYVEAKSFPAVVKILQGMSGVAHSSRNGPPIVKAINIQDMPLLLSMEHPVIRLSSWAWIKSGLYKGDLALVREFNALSQLYEVYVVPRLAYGSKRKCGNRPLAALFDTALAERTFNSKVEVHNQARLFRGKLYLSGLYLAEFHILKLTTEGVNATNEELQHFQHLPEWEEARNLIFPIKEGDRVHVVSGTFKGGWGMTLEVKTTSMCLFWEDSRQDIREVLMRDVHRFFRLGEYVKILYGPNRGDQGFIVHLAGSEAVVYMRHSPGVSTDQFGGYEVSKFLTHNFGGAQLSLSH
jgi:ribosomal protein L24